MINWLSVGVSLALWLQDSILLWQRVLGIQLSVVFFVKRFYALSQNCWKRLLASSCLSVCPSLRMQQLGFHWTDFDKTWYLSFFRKSVEKIKMSLKPDKITGTLHEDVSTFMTISR
jgi:hypothetical protein